MLRRTIIVFAATLLPLTAGAQAPPPPAAKETPRETKDAPRSYVPGLEQFMNVILIEHNKLWFAARERNWPLAAYELGEIKEIMGDVQELVPTFKSLPLADMLDAVITKEIVTLEKAIEARHSQPAMTSSPPLAMRATREPKTDSSSSSVRRSRPSPIRTIGHATERAP
jgi:hypothetical protein